MTGWSKAEQELGVALQFSIGSREIFVWLTRGFQFHDACTELEIAEFGMLSVLFERGSVE